jgi:ATP-dependent RNA helicase DeaD
VDQEGRDTPSVASGVARNHNVVYVMPHDWASIAHVLAPVLARVDEASASLQALIVTSDAELAAATAAAAVKVAEGREITVLAATSAKRTARLLQLRPAQVIAGPSDVLVDLLQAAAVKLDGIRAVCIAWADEIVVRDALGSLETLIAEVPKDAARTIVSAELSPSIETLIERYARRARRVLSPTEEGQSVNLEYITVPSTARLEMLRRILDEIDPRSSLIFARESEAEVGALVRALGYPASDSPVVVGRVASPETELAVLFDLPASRGELREACSMARRVIALIRPRQLPSLRTLAGGGAVRPLTLSEAGARARNRDARLRSELHDVLARGHFGRDLMALEPLLDEYDGIEIAAAAVHLLESARATPAAPAVAATPSAPRERPAHGDMVRLFVNVGARDNLRAGDLVGAFTNEGRIEGSDVGKIDIRESHAIVEVSPSAADAVIERVTGTPIRGRRAIVRRDEGRRDEARPRGDRGERSDRPPRERSDRGDRSDRPPRVRSDRGDRTDRPPRERSDRGDRTDRPPRERSDRGARPMRKEWTPRSSRPARRGPREERE